MNDTVIIAGGGPAGLMLACELGVAGIPSVVLEGRERRATDSYGMVLHARSVEALRQRGIADRFRDDDTPVWPRVHFGLIWLDLSELGATEYNLLVPQWRTEQLLEERAVELGARVLHGHRVTAVDQDDHGVRVVTRSAAGEQTFAGAYAVGCDGVDSTVARLAGFPYTEMAPSYYGVMADVAHRAGDDDAFEAGNFTIGQFGVLPIRPGEVRLMTVEYEREPEPAEVPVTVAELRESIRRITGTAPELPEPRWIARFGHPTRLADQYRRGRILLAGDSAHAHFPSAGHGLNTTLHDAVNLGWKLAGVLRGWAPESLLDTYQEERRPVGRRACLGGQVQVALQYPVERAAPLREIFTELLRFGDVNRYLVQLVTHVRYETPGCTHPLAGPRCPDVRLTTPAGPRLVSDLLHEGHGVLLWMSPADPPDVGDRLDRLDVVAAEPVPELPAAVLVRPDGHVAWAGAAGDEGLLTAIKTWFG